jgi:hypothetical protein
MYPIAIVLLRRVFLSLLRGGVKSRSLNFAGSLVLLSELLASTPQFFVLCMIDDKLFFFFSMLASMATETVGVALAMRAHVTELSKVVPLLPLPSFNAAAATASAHLGRVVSRSVLLRPDHGDTLPLVPAAAAADAPAAAAAVAPAAAAALALPAAATVAPAAAGALAPVACPADGSAPAARMATMDPTTEKAEAIDDSEAAAALALPAAATVAPAAAGAIAPVACPADGSALAARMATMDPTTEKAELAIDDSEAAVLVATKVAGEVLGEKVALFLGCGVALAVKGMSDEGGILFNVCSLLVVEALTDELKIWICLKHGVDVQRAKYVFHAPSLLAVVLQGAASCCILFGGVRINCLVGSQFVDTINSIVG